MGKTSRQQARQEKRYAENVPEGISFAACVRNELQSAGITIMDQLNEQTRWHR